MRVTPLLVFHFSCSLLLRKVFLLFVFFALSFQYKYIFSYIFHCWHQFQSLTVDVSSVVSAPWRCGVPTTWGGIAGIGLGHPLGREHDSTPRSGVEAPRLIKRSLSRLYSCSCCVCSVCWCVCCCVCCGMCCGMCCCCSCCCCCCSCSRFRSRSRCRRRFWWCLCHVMSCHVLCTASASAGAGAAVGVSEHRTPNTKHRKP